MNGHKKQEAESDKMLVSYFKDVFLLQTGLSNLPLFTSLHRYTEQCIDVDGWLSCSCVTGIPGKVFLFALWLVFKFCSDTTATTKVA